jgi:CheY-like chemotaxis protein
MSHVLVVDDSLLMRRCASHLLEQAGYLATTAANGKEAYASLYSAVPDLIVLDLMMPQMDGITFLRFLRQHHFWNAIPVIVLTGHADEERLLDEARALGVSDVIFKGTSAIDELVRRVNELLPQERKAARRSERLATQRA